MLGGCWGGGGGVLGGGGGRVASGIFGVELLRWLSLLRGAWATSWPKLRFLALPGSLKSANGGRRRSSGFGACGAFFLVREGKGSNLTSHPLKQRHRVAFD